MMLICSNVLKDIGLSVLFVTVAEEEKPFSKIYVQLFIAISLYLVKKVQIYH